MILRSRSKFYSICVLRPCGSKRIRWVVGWLDNSWFWFWLMDELKYWILMDENLWDRKRNTLIYKWLCLFICILHIHRTSLFGIIERENSSSENDVSEWKRRKWQNDSIHSRFVAISFSIHFQFISTCPVSLSSLHRRRYQVYLPRSRNWHDLRCLGVGRGGGVFSVYKLYNYVIKSFSSAHHNPLDARI